MRVLWQKTCTAYAVLRAVRLLQARGSVPGHAGLEVGPVHVHHYVHGLALLVLQQALSRGRGHCLHRPVRANLLGTGAALVLDELDVISGAERSCAARRVRLALDLVGAAGAVVGTRDLRRTWSGWYPGRWAPEAQVRPSRS